MGTICKRLGAAWTTERAWGWGTWGDGRRTVARVCLVWFCQCAARTASCSAEAVALSFSSRLNQCRRDWYPIAPLEYPFASLEYPFAPLEYPFASLEYRCIKHGYQLITIIIYR
ncbi:hypothetical protein M758_4G033400 [Ceratodon purpureus]|nr:hypothetical protein M758_4G033400 [Ceratodon purpureus]